MKRKLTRRDFAKLAAGGAVAGLGLSGWLRRAIAMARRPEFQGVHKLSGDVRVNGKTATIGTLVNVGDTVTTGPDGFVVFVAGLDAFLLRENGRLVLGGEGALITRLRVQAGKLLSVFAPGKAPRRFETVTVVVGVRGTGLYIEAEKKRTYVCTCYGTSEISPTADPSAAETVTTRHHEAPRYVYLNGKNRQLIEKAPVVNHTDDELVMLEWLVGRRPPFDPNTGYSK
jgi:hypothetical protein